MVRSRTRRWLTLGVVATSIATGLLSARPPLADFLYKKASAEYQAGRRDSARWYVELLSVLRRPTPFDRLLRGFLAVSDHQHDRAYVELGAIPDVHPLAPLARTLLGQSELRRGLVRRAEALFLEAVRLAPNALQARRELAYIYNIQHRQIELDLELEAINELQTLSFDHLLLWSKTRSVEWSPKADMATLQKYREIDEHDRWSRLALAEGLRRKNDLDGAERMLGELPPTDPEGLAMRALNAFDRGDAATAESLLASGPRGNPSLERLRGQLALSRRDADTAVEAYRSAYEADPLVRSTIFGLANALHMQGDVQAAERLFAVVRKLDAIHAVISYAATEAGAEDPDVPRRMGLACLDAGRIAEARAWLKLAVNADPLDQSAQKSLYKLNQEHPSRFAKLGRPPSGTAAEAGPNLAGTPRAHTFGLLDPVAPTR